MSRLLIATTLCLGLASTGLAFAQVENPPVGKPTTTVTASPNTGAMSNSMPVATSTGSGIHPSTNGNTQTHSASSGPESQGTSTGAIGTGTVNPASANTSSGTSQ